MAVILRSLRCRLLWNTVRQIAISSVIDRTSCLKLEYCTTAICPKCGGCTVIASRSLASGSSWPDEEQKRINLRDARIMQGIVLILILVGCVAYYVLWHFNKRQFAMSKADLPDPLDWEEFVTDFLTKEKVQSVNFFCDFNVADVFLKSRDGEAEGKERQKPWFFERNAQKPDLRFWFGGSEEELKEAVENALLDSGSTEDVEMRSFSYPSKLDIGGIVVAVLFTLTFLTSSLKRRGIGTRPR